ncbi:MAG: hypothetical protein ACE5R6_05240 [Candidatus Heimdallarchaeota archaeon]
MTQLKIGDKAPDFKAVTDKEEKSGYSSFNSISAYGFVFNGNFDVL